MADYFITYDVVQKVGNLPKVAQATIEEFFPEAKRDVIDRIGQANYDTYFAKGDTDDDFLRIRTAEARYVLCYLIPAVNVSTSGDGITKEQGFGDSRRVVMSEADINLMVDRQRELADKILTPYARLIDLDEDEDNDVIKVPNIGMAAINDDLA
jgi:hypothetical protein